MSRHVLVVGASLAGLRLAEQLRALGHEGPITVAGAETHMPYNRPPLSKTVLTEGDDAAALAISLGFRLRPALGDVTWRLGAIALAADLDRRSVAFSDGSRLSYDGLAIATGLSPRRLPLAGPKKDRFVLRTLDDALALRARLGRGVRLVVIGGGFIGCEVAASAAKLGCTVTIVETLAAPMQRAVGLAAGRAMQELHATEGVAFRMNAKVAGFIDHGHGRLAGVRLENGEVLACDVALEALGAIPNTSWLAGNGLDLSDGVLCDNRMCVEGRPDVVACGDIARFPNLFTDHVPRRIEHWSIPALTAKRAALSLIAHFTGAHSTDQAFAPLPSFWSDQHGVRLQSYGAPALGDRSAVLEGALEADDFRNGGAVEGWYRGDRLIGVVAIGLPPARLAEYRDLVEESRERC
jgi:3-phenylpropionate/trans-cinnamate dioxygenase ferredoxin reductase component